MNLLLDRPPTQVEIGGLFYDIDADFRTGIAFEMLMQDDEFTDLEKAGKTLDLFYPVLPSDMDRAMERILWFYTCGKPMAPQQDEQGGSIGNRVYDYDHDTGYIYAAFLAQYNVDLVEIPYLHWWKFKALFHALDENQEFMKIMRYRALDITQVPEEQKDYYRKMKHLYALPDGRTEQEKEQDFVSSLTAGL